MNLLEIFIYLLPVVVVFILTIIILAFRDAASKREYEKEVRELNEELNSDSNNVRKIIIKNTLNNK